MADPHDHREILCREFVELVTEYLEGALPGRARRARRAAPGDVRLVQDLPRAARGDGAGAAGGGRAGAGSARRPSSRCWPHSASGGTGPDRIQVPAPGRRRSVQRAPLAGPCERRAGRVGRATAFTRASATTCRCGSGRSSGRSSSAATWRRTTRSCGPGAGAWFAAWSRGRPPERRPSPARAPARAAHHAAEPLRAAGHAGAAAVLDDGTDLPRVRELTAELWDRLPASARIPMGMASDGALRALTATESGDHYVAAHGGAVSAYIAAMTALRVAGRERHDAERAWQADWLPARSSSCNESRTRGTDGHGPPAPTALHVPGDRRRAASRRRADRRARAQARQRDRAEATPGGFGTPGVRARRRAATRCASTARSSSTAPATASAAPR